MVAAVRNAAKKGRGTAEHEKLRFPRPRIGAASSPSTDNAMSALDSRSNRRATVPIQPEPLNWIVSFLPGRDGGATAITRLWSPGDTRRCRLCPTCTALHAFNSCQVQARGEIPEESIPLFSLHGRDVWTTDTTHHGIVRPVQGDAVG